MNRYKIIFKENIETALSDFKNVKNAIVDSFTLNQNGTGIQKGLYDGKFKDLIGEKQYSFSLNLNFKYNYDKVEIVGTIIGDRVFIHEINNKKPNSFTDQISKKIKDYFIDYVNSKKDYIKKLIEKK